MPSAKARGIVLLVAVTILHGGARLALAVPPLVSGDVPTADRGTLETFLGLKYQESGAIEREIPFVEWVYGLTGRQELTVEGSYLSLSEPGAPTEAGFGDVTLGTKIVLWRETPAIPATAVSFEVKLANGDETKGLGSGATDYAALLRAEKNWGGFIGTANLGYTLVGEPRIAGQRRPRDNAVFAALAQSYPLTAATRLVSEEYLETAEEPGEPNRFAANLGFKHDLAPWLQLQAAIGKSLRAGNEGGPALRAYVGFHAVTVLAEGAGR